MALIKCKNCGKDISDKATSCIHCNTSFNNSNNNDLYTGNLNGVEKNINYFFRLAFIIKILAIIFSIIIIICSFFFDNILITILSIIFGILFIFIVFLLTPFIKWKGYMLKNIYELNKK